jgi:DNA-binding CsgD family transcriptional regulator
MLVQGPAGIGKTVLLEEARLLAISEGVEVLFARGDVLEQAFPYGVVRQLFEAALVGLPSRRRREALAGAAATAAPLLVPETAGATSASPTDRSFAVLHGLYWLTANLSARIPVWLVIDDLHWSDGPTLRFVNYLVRRLDGMAVGLLCAIRTGVAEGDRELVSTVSRQPGFGVLRLVPLGEAAVGRILSAGLGEHPEARFVVACHAATGGVPFLVGELVRALAMDGVRPTADNVLVVDGLGPSAVAAATLMRLSSLPGPATSLAQAVAVLGSHARLDRAASLAGLDETDALDVADGLVSAQILGASQQLEFVHPIVRAAIYEDLSPGQRSRLHGRAAQLLADEQADVDVVASQLLPTAPAGHVEVVARLRAGAARAVDRGAPDGAVVYLQRALDEGLAGRELQAGLLYELGVARRLLFEPDAHACFEQALSLEDDPVRRARISVALAEMRIGSGRAGPLRLIESALVELGDRDTELAVRLRTLRAVVWGFEPGNAAEFERQLPSLLEAVAAHGAGARELSLVLAGVLAARGAKAGEVRGLLDHGLAGGKRLAIEGVEWWALIDAFHALIAIDEPAWALQLAEEMVANTRQAGSLLGFTMALSQRAWAEVRRGNLVGGEADLRSALDGLREYRVPATIGFILWFGTEALIERPALADVAATVEMFRTLPADSYQAALSNDLRGRLRLSAGRSAEGIDDLRAFGESMEALGFRNPNLLSWRSALGLALASEDPEEARALIESERADAERIGLARGIGVALRSAGVLEGGKKGLAFLEEAVAVLERSPARLELARALVAFGSVLRRSNQRAAARVRLRAGLDIAHDCGAVRLAERARTELVSAGAKPRRMRVTGRDALTPSEQRIARMAADGLRNREIAQALFVTAKTVENHLGRIYQKLAINGRGALADALDREQLCP